MYSSEINQLTHILISLDNFVTNLETTRNRLVCFFGELHDGIETPSLDEGATLSISSNCKKSYLFSGLNHNTIFIHGNLNHLVLRNSRHTKIVHFSKIISGLEILNCKDIEMQTKKFNSAEIELSQKLRMFGGLDSISQVSTHNCLDAELNSRPLPFAGAAKPESFTESD